MRQKIKLFFIFKPYKTKIFILRVKIRQFFRRPDLTKIIGVAPGLSELTNLKELRKEWD